MVDQVRAEVLGQPVDPPGYLPNGVEGSPFDFVQPSAKVVQPSVQELEFAGLRFPERTHHGADIFPGHAFLCSSSVPGPQGATNSGPCVGF
jgi:hypothetical protein